MQKRIRNILSGSKVIRLLLAHSFGQVVTLLSMVVLPIFALRTWSLGEYGQYLLLMAIAQIFSNVDIGSIQGLSNKLVLKGVNPDFAKSSIKTLHKKLEMLVLVFNASAFFYICLLEIPEDGAKLSLCVLIVAAVMQIGVNIRVALYRVEGRLHHGVLYSNKARLVEFLTLIIILSLNFKIEICCLGIFLIRALYYLDLCRFMRSIKNTTESIERVRFFEYSSIALGNLGFTVSTQGYLTVASAVSNEAAAIVSLYRTVTRLPYQPSVLLVNSFAPYLTEAYAKSGFDAIYKYIKYALILTFLGLITYGFIIVVFESYIERYWLVNKLNLELTTTFVFLVSTLFSVLVLILSSFLSSVNKMEGVGFLSVLYLFVLYWAVYTLFSVWKVNVIIVASTLLIIDFGLLCIFFAKLYRVRGV